MLRASLNILQRNSLTPEGHHWKSGQLMETATNRIYVPIDEKKELIKTMTHNPETFGGINKLYDGMSKYFSTITRKDISDVLQEDGLYQAQRPNKMKTSVRSVITTDMNKKAQIDLIDMTKYKGYNNMRTFVLTYIDAFSKYVEAEPLLTKGAKHMIEALDNILDRVHKAVGSYPSVIQSDNGSEFGKYLETHLKAKYDIKLVHSNPYTPTSQGLVERFNSTLKRYIFRNFNITGDFKYLDVLPKLISNVNNSKQKATGLSPLEIATNGITDEQRKTLIKKQRSNIKPNDDEEKFKEGDYVRINLNVLPEYRRQLSTRKKIIQNWTLEVYQIAEISKSNKYVQSPRIFTLYDPSDNTLLNERFYSHQLQKADPASEV